MIRCGGTAPGCTAAPLGSLGRPRVPGKPLGRPLAHLLECPRRFEEVARARHHGPPARAPEVIQRAAIHRQRALVP